MAEIRTRPFALTLQAQRLDHHLVWGVLLALAMAMLLAWGAWACSDRVPVHASSTRVTVEPLDPGATEVERGRILSARLEPLPELNALIEDGALIGREALVVLRDGEGSELITAEIIAVAPSSDGEWLLRLRAARAPGEPDPFARRRPHSLRMAVGERSPLELALPELTRLDWPFRR